MHILYDLRAATIDISLPEIKHLVGLLQAHGQKRGAGFRLAFVASQSVTYTIIRLYQALAEDLPEETRVFQSMAEARQWLGVED